MLEGKWDGGCDWTKRGNGRVSVDLVLLANRATHNEMLDKGGKTQPPGISLKDRLGAEGTHVTQEGGRVDQMEESKAGQGRNIHVFAKIKMSIVK